LKFLLGVEHVLWISINRVVQERCTYMSKSIKPLARN